MNCENTVRAERRDVEGGEKLIEQVSEYVYDFDGMKLLRERK